MAMPEDLNPIATRVYEEIRPVAYDDAANDYFLAHMIEAWTRPMIIIEQIARDTDDGPGYSAIFSPERAPVLFLNWLSQVVGSVPKSGETEEQARIRIAGMTGLRRGSAQAARAAATKYLVSSDPNRPPLVVFNERAEGNAWRVAVRTLDTETPDETVVRNALMEQKPVGIVLTYDSSAGVTYDTVFAAYDSYDDLFDAYPDYAHVVTDFPA